MAANLRYQLGFQCICWNTAETVIHYSARITSHTGISPPALIFLMKNKEAWRQSLGIALAQTECLPTLKFSAHYFARRPPLIFTPGSCKGLEKTVLNISELRAHLVLISGRVSSELQPKPRVPKRDHVSASTFLSMSEQFSQPPCHEPAVLLILVTDDGN